MAGQAFPGYPTDESTWCLDFGGPNPPYMVVTFERPVQQSSITTSTLYLQRNAFPFDTLLWSLVGYLGVDGDLATAIVIQVDPSPAITVGVQWDVHVTDGIIDEDGCPVTPVVWSFIPGFCT